MQEFTEILTEPYTLWIAVGLGLLILEFSAPAVVLGFFGFGALITGLLCTVFDFGFSAQILIFTLVSCTLLFGLRRVVKPLLSATGGMNASDIHEMEGKTAVVTVKIRRNFPGRVELNGVEWKAVSSQPVETGVPVTVLSRDNLTLTVAETTNP